MRRLGLLSALVLAACGGGPTMSAPPTPSPTATPVEDLDLQLADFGSIPGLTRPAGRNYFVANLLGHETEALAVAASPTGGQFPVGSVVRLSAAEVMVKRRVGFSPATNDWEFFGIAFGADGAPERFTLRGTQETSCFQCHSRVSSPKWDFICEHP